MLKFKDGKFKIMQITDIQDVIETAADTVKLIETALDREKPDLVVFTGDQIKGYSSVFKKGDVKAKVTKALENQLKPIIKRGIPFAVTFGNHDEQCGLSCYEQFEIYKSFDCNVSEDTKEELDVCGTYNLPIYNDKGEMKFNLYIINSRGYTGKIGVYSAITENDIKWYRNKREELKEKNNGEYVPSLVFQHIPVPEIGRLLKKVKPFTRKAVQGGGNFKGFYMIDKEKCFDKNALFGETPASPAEDVGEFEAIKEKGDVIGMYFGHDHLNNFAGKVDNVDLGYTQGAGFNIYGPGLDRGVRVFEIFEDDVRNYKTRILTYRQLCGKRPIQPILNLLTTIEPPSVFVAVRLFFGILSIIALIVLIISLIIKFL